MIKTYITQLTTLILGLSFLMWIVIYILEAKLSLAIIMIPVVCMTLGLLFIFPLKAVHNKTPSVFMWFCANMGIKMIISGCFIVLMLGCFILPKATFVGIYLCFYLALLGLETKWFLKLIKQ